MSAIARTSTGQLFRAIRINTNTRAFSVAARMMAEGDAGATRSGGASSGDAFTKREQAQEGSYIRQQELAKLEKLRAKAKASEAELAKQKEEIARLEKDHK